MTRNKTNKPRVFCIGWHKTGTSTLGLALLDLGYEVVGARLDMSKPLLEGDTGTAIRLAVNFDALQDVPWAALFKELDAAYPESKFILTVRDEESWLNSAKKHFGDTYVGLHEWLYGKGILQGNEELYLERFRKHYSDVKDYFAGREDDILVMDLLGGDTWEKLCDFLNEPIPEKPFPYENKGKHNYTRKDKLKDTLRKLVPAPLRRLRVSVLKEQGLHYGRNRFNNHPINKQWREKEDRNKKA